MACNNTCLMGDICGDRYRGGQKPPCGLKDVKDVIRIEYNRGYQDGYRDAICGATPVAKESPTTAPTTGLAS